MPTDYSCYRCLHTPLSRLSGIARDICACCLQRETNERHSERVVDLIRCGSHEVARLTANDGPAVIPGAADCR